MNLTIQMTGPAGPAERTVDFEREGSRVRAVLDGRAVEADALIVAPGVFSILLGGRSLEVRVVPQHDGLHIHSDGRDYVAQVQDPRAWRGGRGGADAAEGNQQIVAPMPGKVVRVLVQPGENIAAGQGVAVVEAMKMQNDIRSPRAGKVERLQVEEGQAVNAGQVLAVVV
jgi:biotin carboxyl carrier protein